jgi:hypothetical protein
MPRATARDESEYPLPADELLPAVLQSVTEKTTKFTWKPHHKAVQEGREKAGTEGVIEKWEWTFSITDGEYAGLRAWGETPPFLSTREDNKVGQWGTALRGGGAENAYQVGDAIDTDDLVGLPCMITVQHDPPRPKANGDGNFYGCPVHSVFPANSADDLPPF